MWLLRILGAAAALLVVAYLIRRGTSRVQPRSAEDSVISRSVGGGTWFTTFIPWGVTWPLVRLDQFAWGIRVGPNSPWIAWAMPTTEMAWGDIERVRHTKTTIRFTRKDVPGWVSFGFPGYEPASVLLVALQEHGIPYEG